MNRTPLTRALRALALAPLLLVTAPAGAGAGTVSVGPFVEPPLPPWDDGFGSCSRYMMCPADMVLFTAPPGEANEVTITRDYFGYLRFRIVVRDERVPVQPGPGCERVDDRTAACVAGAIGPVQLGDGDDRLDSPGGFVEGGDGADMLNVDFGNVQGDDGDDVLVGGQGEGGGGADLLAVTVGRGDDGDDVLNCFPQGFNCDLRGGPGDDLLTGGPIFDRLFGDRGDDLVRGGGHEDSVVGGPGDDRLVGGTGQDSIVGGAGADRLEAREDRSTGEQPERDRVDCGAGRRDRALTDRRDRVRRCERLARR
jgi:RTX calcium-binding nonapeptide repeat (4 copies)